MSSCHSFVYCRPGCTPSPTTQSGCRSSSSRSRSEDRPARSVPVSSSALTVLAVSMLTKYPLGVAKVLPFTVHSAGDYLAAVLLLAAPWVLNFARRRYRSDRVLHRRRRRGSRRQPDHQLPVQPEARVGPDVRRTLSGLIGRLPAPTAVVAERIHLRRL